MERRALLRALRYVDSWLAWRQAHTDVPGIAVAVSHRGQVLLDAAYGVADAATAEALTPSHRFRVASHSKTFTATAVLQLAERGALRLDDPAAHHLPWLAAHRDARYHRVTIRQLLAHGAGVVRDGADADFWQLARPYPDADGFRAEVLAAGLVTDPDVALKYSNYGYTLLGLVVEAAGGRPYEDHVVDHIVAPLRLEATGPEPRPDLPGPWATGHGRRGPDGTRRTIAPLDTRAMAAATGFYATASDLCRSFSAHFVGSGRLLADESKREMQRTHWHVHRPGAGPHPHQDYGLGLVIETVGARRTFGHSGGFPGHITRTLADPADEVVVSVLTNCIDGPASDIATGVLATLDRITSAPAPPARLRRLEGRYVNLWSATDVVAAGDRLLLASPDTWSPLAEPDEVAGPDARSLRVVETSSFGSAGEPVTFTMEAGTAVSVRLAGMTSWSEARWPAVEAGLAGPG